MSLLSHSHNSFVFIILITAITTCIQPDSALAQFGGINAEFAGGGARALAMGGAFIALGDDATAAEFNPAGLWQLRTPEMALQGIYTQDDRNVPLPRRTFAENQPVFQESHDTYFIPSFASFVYPTQYVAIGISEFTNVYYDRTYTDLFPVGYQNGQFIYAKSRIRERAENYAFGLTLARGITDQFIIGSTFRYNTFRYRSDEGEYGDSSEFDADAFSANVGMIWRVTPRFRIGAVYKSPQDLQGHYGPYKVDTELPDTFGLGIAWLPSQRWRLLADVDYIRWSNFDPNPDDFYAKEDVWRCHFGAEWYAGKWNKAGVFLRGGYLYEESNAYHYKGSNSYLRKLASETDSIHHYTFGIGFALRQFQMDFGMDVTENAGYDLIASTVWYF